MDLHQLVSVHSGSNEPNCVLSFPGPGDCGMLTLKQRSKKSASFSGNKDGKFKRECCAGIASHMQ